MANNIKVKRSATPSKVPTTTDLQLGEIAVNTYDGKMYIKKDNGTASVVEIGGTAGSGDVVGPSSATDNAVARFDTTTGKLIQNSVVTIDDNGNEAGVNSITFDITPTTPPSTTGAMYWDEGNKSPSVNLDADVTLQLGQEMLALVYNGTGLTIPNGSVVAVSGAQGQRPSVVLADADSEALSAPTLGIATEDIANGAEGFVTTFGFVRGINTSAFTAGAPIYLGTTAGSFTATRPPAPAHTVALGWVIKVNASSGEVFVNINNGWELDELHNVLITSPISGNTLIYDASVGVWKNANITAGTGISVTNGAGSITIANTGVTSVTGTSPIASSGGTNPAISISQATTSTNGYLSSTDWNTFNSKGTGSVTSVALSGGTTGLTVTGSPITTSGTIALAGTLAVANGGTGLTSLTAGYIPFGAGTSALGNSANFVWDNTNTRLGVGTSSPAASIHVVNETNSGWRYDQYNNGDGTNFRNYRARGTIASPTAVQAGDRLGSFLAAGYSTSSFSGINGGISIFASETYSGTSCGTYLTFGTTANGANSGGGGLERMRIDNAGNVGIATTTPSFRLQLGTNATVSTATPETFSLGGTYSSTAGANGKIRVWTDGSNYMGFGVSASQLDYICTSAFNHAWHTNGSERMRISAAGGLSVGTTTDAGAGNLRVNGSIITGGAITTGGTISATGTGSAQLQTSGDIYAYRSGGTTGVIFLNSAGTRYLYNDGTNYSLPAQGLVVGGAINGTNITASGSLVVGTSGTYTAGSLYSDSNWGMILRAKQASPAITQFLFTDSTGAELVRIGNSGALGCGTVSCSSITTNGAITANGNNNYSYQFAHGNWSRIILPAGNNGAGNGDAGLYFWISEPAATWTGAGIGRNRRNDGASFSRVNTALNGQMIRFGEGVDFYFTSQDTAGTNYSPLTLNGNNATIAGTCTASTFSATSDERLKTNWRPVQEDFVAKLANIKSGVYDRTDQELTQAGVSAQSLQTLLPESVNVGQDDMLNVSYGNAALVSAIELAKVVQELRVEIAELKLKIKE